MLFAGYILVFFFFLLFHTTTITKSIMLRQASKLFTSVVSKNKSASGTALMRSEQQHRKQDRSVYSFMSKDKKVVTLVHGDGIGPEICHSAVGVVLASGAPVEFEQFSLPPINSPSDPLLPLDLVSR